MKQMHWLLWSIGLVLCPLFAGIGALSSNQGFVELAKEWVTWMAYAAFAMGIYEAGNSIFADQPKP